MDLKNAKIIVAIVENINDKNAQIKSFEHFLNIYRSLLPSLYINMNVSTTMLESAQKLPLCSDRVVSFLRDQLNKSKAELSALNGKLRSL